MYKETRTGECSREKGHASFLCIMIHNRAWSVMLLIMMLCADVLCGCGKKSDAVYIAAEESSDIETGAVSDETETVSDGGEAISSESNAAQTDKADRSDGFLYVYVCGAVESPGLYALAEGSRVYDAIAAAGGLASDACPDYWNQAAYVSDGQMIDVPTQTEVDEGLVSQASGTGSYSDSGKVNINTATQEELMTLSGIGEARAAAIISYREEHGAFSDIEDIKNVSGIGDALYEKICDEIVAD